MIDRRLIGIASDPERRDALTLLNERSAGAAEVAEKLGIETAAAGRLLDQMRDAGLIEVVGEALNRGAVEPRYRALVHMLLDGDDWAALDLEERKRTDRLDHRDDRCRCPRSGREWDLRGPR